MSLETKRVHVDKNQTYSQGVDLRFHGDKLYICKIENDGSIIRGAEVVLDWDATGENDENGSLESDSLESDSSEELDTNSLKKISLLL